mgnify:CR=1 FL=1
MGSPRIYKKVIDGRLITAQPRRGYVEVKVYAGLTAAKNEEPVGHWDMPNLLRRNLDVAALQGALQTPKEN